MKFGSFFNGLFVNICFSSKTYLDFVVDKGSRVADQLTMVDMVVIPPKIIRLASLAQDVGLWFS